MITQECLIQAKDSSKDTWCAKEQVVYALAMITRCDEGILAAIRCDVPACIVALVKQALEPQFIGSAGASMRCSCAECLAQMSHHVDGKARMREAGAIDVLTELLKAQVRAVLHQPMILFQP